MAFAPLAQTVIMNDGPTARAVTSAVVIPGAGVPPAAITAGPTIQTDGTPSAGETFSAVYTATNSTGADFRWVLDGATVATTPTFASPAGSLRVGVTPKGPGGNGAEVVSAPVTVSPAPSVDNTLGTSSLLGTEVSGFATIANALDARLTALSV